jgi:hypothetical protein
MEQNTTIPSILGPMGGSERPAARKAAESGSSPVFKLVFWAAVGVLLVSAFRYFMH